MKRFLTFLWLAAGCYVVGQSSAKAQPTAAAPAASVPTAVAPPPTAAADDDVEITAAPAGTTPTTPAIVAAPTPVPTSAAAQPSAAELAARTQALEQHNAELEARLAALEQAGAEQKTHEAEAAAAPKNAHLGPQVSAYAQTEYQSSQTSEDQLAPGGTALNHERFVVRRARLRFDDNWDYARLSLEIDVNPTRSSLVGVRRAYGAVFWPNADAPDAPPYIELKVGLQEIPFGFEVPYGNRNRIFMERSQASLAFFPGEPDVGASVAGGWGALRYAVAVLNGNPVADKASGLDITDTNAAKELVGRVGVDTKPKDWLTVAGGVSFLSGSGFHAGSDATKNQLGWRDVNGDSVVQTGTEVVAVPGSGATRSQNFKRWAVGADAELGLRTTLGWSKLYGEISVASNLDRGLFIADPIANNDNNTRELGYYIAFVQEVTRWGLVGFRADFYNGNADLSDSRRGMVVPANQSIHTYSPLIGVVLPERARLVFQYDFIEDSLGRDKRGVPTDLRNDQWTLRLQVGI